MIGAPARRFPLGILFVILLAFGTRLYAIDRQDIWGDEAFSIWLSSQPLPQVVAGGADTHPPLYPFLLKLWLGQIGSTPLASRTLSAMIGTLTVPVIYALGRRAFLLQELSDRRIMGCGRAELVALLAAVSPVLVYYSQETRMYGLVTLLAAASVYWAMRIFRGSRAFTTWLAYYLTTLGAAYTHYYAFFVILAENLVLVPVVAYRRRWKDLGRWLAAQAALLLAYIPWIAVQTGFLSGKASARFDEWAPASALRIAGDTVAAFAAGLAVAPTEAAIIAALSLLAIVAGLVAVVRSRRPELWLVATYLLLPLILAWAVNPIMPFFYPRYLLLIAPAFYLLVALGVLALGQIWRPLVLVGISLLLVASGIGLFGYYTNDAYLKGRYGQMMAYIQANAQPGDGLILANQLQRPIFEYYQPAGMEPHFFPRYDYPLEDPRTARDLADIASQHPRLWLVRFGNPAEYDPDGYLTRWLATHGSNAYYDGWLDADLSLYVMAPASDGEDIPNPLRAGLGNEIQLIGHALSASEVAPGETLLLTLYWQASAPPAGRYTVFTHLLDGADQIQAQMDSEPQGGGLPTDRWTAGQIVQDNYALTVSPDAAPGPHLIEVGMYQLSSMERLPVRDLDTGASLGDRVLLGSVEVVAP
jgi:hypothetical protein